MRCWQSKVFQSVLTYNVCRHRLKLFRPDLNEGYPDYRENLIYLVCLGKISMYFLLSFSTTSIGSPTPSSRWLSPTSIWRLTRGKDRNTARHWGGSRGSMLWSLCLSSSGQSSSSSVQITFRKAKLGGTNQQVFNFVTSLSWGFPSISV